MSLKQVLAVKLDDLSRPNGWRRVRKTPTYARAITDGIDARFGLTFGGRGAGLLVLGYVSVYCEAVHRLGAQLQGKRFVSHAVATFGYPVNGLPPKGETGIWSLDVDNADEVAREVYRDCVRCGEPIWDAHKTIEDIAATVADPLHDLLDWQRPVAYYLAGKVEDARAAAQRMVDEAGEDAAHFGFDVFQERLEARIAEDLGSP